MNDNLPSKEANPAILMLKCTKTCMNFFVIPKENSPYEEM
jgi:hypothetical protein